jgi:hypothetical protein
MNNINYNSFIASPYWRWRTYSDLRISHQPLPKRENNDNFKHISKTS